MADLESAPKITLRTPIFVQEKILMLTSVINVQL